MLKIEFENLSDRKLILRVSGARQKIVDALQSRLTRILYMLPAYIVSKKLSGNPIHRRTGLLAASIRTTGARIEGNTVRGEVLAGGGPAETRARILEMGGAQRVYEIAATKAKALAWLSGEKMQFARSVQHPPQLPMPYLKPSLEENAPSIREQLQAELDRIVNEP